MKIKSNFLTSEDRKALQEHIEYSLKRSASSKKIKNNANVKPNEFFFANKTINLTKNKYNMKRGRFYTDQ